MLNYTNLYTVNVYIYKQKKPILILENNINKLFNYSINQSL